jgi:hypothetical protein
MTFEGGKNKFHRVDTNASEERADTKREADINYRDLVKRKMEAKSRE